MKALEDRTNRNLGELEQLLLLAVLRVGDDAYGTSVRREIEARTGRKLTAGAVFTALERLERRGFVSSRMGDPTPVRGGKRKRYYRVEARGIDALRRSQHALQEMLEGLGARLELS